MKPVIFTLAIFAICLVVQIESFRLRRQANRISCPRRYSTGLFSYPPDCSKFLNCWNGRGYLQDCAPGTLFNARIGVCDWPYNTQCAGYGGAGLIDPRVNYVRWKLAKLFKNTK